MDLLLQTSECRLIPQNPKTPKPLKVSYILFKLIHIMSNSISANTLKVVNHTVVVLGPPGVGRTTFINSLNPNNGNIINSGKAQVIQRDVKNSI